MRTEVHLECKHTLFFHSAPPHLKQRIWCNICKDTRVVIGRTGSYHARCRDCGRFDLVRDKPAVLARQIRGHLNGHPKHRVILTRIGTEESVTVTLQPPDTTDSDLPILGNMESPNTLF